MDETEKPTEQPTEEETTQTEETQEVEEKTEEKVEEKTEEAEAPKAEEAPAREAGPIQEIGSLRPFMKKVNVKVKAISKNEVREVTSKLDSSTHNVTEALVGDASGTILLTLWDDNINAVEDGKSYTIENGFTSLFKNSIRLNIGRFGTLKPSEDEVTEVKEDNNLSDKEFDMPRRRF